MTKGSWHRRPILAPFLYGLGTTITSAMAYTFGYLLTDSTRHGLYTLAAVDGLLLLYLWECARTATEEKDDNRR